MPASASPPGSASWPRPERRQVRIEALNAAISKVVQSEAIAERFATLGVIQHLMGPAEFGEFIKSENTRWSEVVKASGAKVD